MMITKMARYTSACRTGRFCPVGGNIGKLEFIFILGLPSPEDVYRQRDTDERDDGEYGTGNSISSHGVVIN